jgi:lambda family phage portal protein
MNAPEPSPLRRAVAAVIHWTGIGSSSFKSAEDAPHRSKAKGAAPRDSKLDLTPVIREEIVRRSRYVHRNSGFAREQQLAMQLYGVGNGIRPQARTLNAVWNADAEKFFRQWGRRADISGRFSWDEIQALVCRALDRDGESFVYKVKDAAGRARLQIIPTHRIKSPKDDSSFEDGIRLGPTGEAVEYAVEQNDGTFLKIPAALVLHVFEPEDESSIRFAPTAQHAINHVLDSMDLIGLEMHAAKDNADVSRVITKETADLNDETDFTLGEDGRPPESSDAPSLQKIVGGKLVVLAPGEDMKSFDSQRPSTTFTGFLEYLKRDSALGHVPYEFATDSSAIGGAGVRLVVTKAERRFAWRTKVLADRLVRGVWEFVIGDAITKGILSAEVDWNDIEFTTPKRVSVDAGREAQANRDDIVLGIKTLEEHFAEQGKDFESEMLKRAQNAKHVLDLAETHNVPLAMLWNPATGAPGAPGAPGAFPPRQDDPPKRTAVQPD